MKPRNTEQIIREICREHRLTRAEFLGGTNKRASWARQHAMLRLQEELGMSLSEIARAVDCHLTSVRYGIPALKARREAGEPLVFKSYALLHLAQRHRTRAVRQFHKAWLRLFPPQRSMREVGQLLGCTHQNVSVIEKSILWKVWMRMRDPHFRKTTSVQ